MHRSLKSRPRALAIGAAAALIVVALGAVALAAGGAHSSRAKVRIKCPRTVRTGQKVTCRVFGRLPRGPRGPQGARGARGQAGPRGKTGNRGPTGPAGVSAYQVVNQVFSAVSVPKSEGSRGLSAVQTVFCPSNKRVIGGGTDLGSNEGPGRPRSATSRSRSAGRTAPAPAGRSSCSTRRRPKTTRSTCGSSRSAPAPAENEQPERLLDEEHLLVLRERPEVVGDDLLELVGGLADARPSRRSACRGRARPARGPRPRPGRRSPPRARPASRRARLEQRPDLTGDAARPRRTR